MARSSFILLAAAALHCMIYTAHCQKNSTAATNSLPTDEAVLDVFASPSLYANDTTAAASGIFTEYGLSPNVTDRLAYTGLGTVAYSQEPITSAGALTLGCGFGYINSNFTAAIVGVGSDFHQQGFSCGRCILLQCDDSSCQEPGRQAVAEIVDQCGECLDADLNIGSPLFETISGRSPSSNPNLSLSWQFIDCSSYINDTIKMLVKPGGTAYYQAFNFANSRQVVTAVQVNGQLLRHETNHYWSWSPANGPINPRVSTKINFQPVSSPGN
jgi:hypothetical protein